MNSFVSQFFCFNVTEQKEIQFPRRKIAYCNGTSTILCKYFFQSNLTHQTSLILSGVHRILVKWVLMKLTTESITSN